MTGVSRRGIPQKALRVGIVLVLLFFLGRQLDQRQATYLAPDRNAGIIAKPAGIVVIGLVFYGRRDRASSMFCYLQRNMVGNGGWPDEVVWVVNTEDPADLQYLDHIIKQGDGKHKKIQLADNKLETRTYYKAWRHVKRGNYYVKIDDDIVCTPFLLYFLFRFFFFFIIIGGTDV
ncbi:unnamed protein product [Fusarium langsethiae]|nr:unnamed protein product [Fusarium langsethiae]